MSDIISSDLNDDMKNSWGTDPVIFKAMDREFRFDLDAAANNDNHKCDRYLTKDDDALSINWSVYDSSIETVWINPPYGRGMIQKYMQKCIEQKAKGITSVLLVPATLDAQWLPISEISEIRIITGGRLSFYHPVTGKKVAGNTKGSMIVIFRPSKMPCVIRLVDRNELIELGTDKLTPLNLVIERFNCINEIMIDGKYYNVEKTGFKEFGFQGEQDMNDMLEIYRRKAAVPFHDWGLVVITNINVARSGGTVSCYVTFEPYI